MRASALKLEREKKSVSPRPPYTAVSATERGDDDDDQRAPSIFQKDNSQIFPKSVEHEITQLEGWRRVSLTCRRWPAHVSHSSGLEASHAACFFLPSFVREGGSVCWGIKCVTKLKKKRKRSEKVEFALVYDTRKKRNVTAIPA